MHTPPDAPAHPACALLAKLVHSCVQERSVVSSAEWRSQMGAVDASVLGHLRSNIRGGFDEERHGPRVGFGNLNRCVSCCALHCVHCVHCLRHGCACVVLRRAWRGAPRRVRLRAPDRTHVCARLMQAAAAA